MSKLYKVGLEFNCISLDSSDLIRCDLDLQRKRAYLLLLLGELDEKLLRMLSYNDLPENHDRQLELVFNKLISIKYENYFDFNLVGRGLAHEVSSISVKEIGIPITKRLLLKSNFVGAPTGDRLLKLKIKFYTPGGNMELIFKELYLSTSVQDRFFLDSRKF